MNPRHLLSSKEARRFAIAGALLLGLVIVCCVFLRISRPADIVAYFGMATECHPIWRQFAFRRFTAGDSASELLRRFPPNRREEFGRYGVYSYYRGPEGIPLTALGIAARDGKILSAESAGCTWQFTFFRTADSDLDAQYEAYYKQKRERRERERLEKTK